jgi:Leucine-rich repeat (LRR) protein
MYDLEMANCGLRSINPHWLKNFEFLGRLEVDMNTIETLPRGVFDLPYLTTLGIASNRIRVLDSRAFGSSVRSIVSLNAGQNEIDAIDRAIIQNATGLSSLTLTGNSCTDSNFIDVQDAMDQVMESLQGCFENFDNL